MRALAAFGYRGEIQNTSNDPFYYRQLSTRPQEFEDRAGEDLVAARLASLHEHV